MLDITALVIVLAVAVAAVGIWRCVTLVPRATVDRFLFRYGLAAPPTPTLIRYLTTRRRWRSLAMTIALVGSLVAHLDESRVEIDVVVLAAGWLIGSLLAYWVRPVPEVAATRVHRYVVPAAVRWTPAAVGVFIVIVGGTILAVGHVPAPGRVASWCVGGILAVTAAVVAVRSIGSWPEPAGAADERSAVAVSSMQAIAAGAVLVGMVCAGHAITVAQAHVTGQTDIALSRVEIMTLVAALVLALILNNASRFTTVSARRSTPVTLIVTVSALAIVIAGAWLGYGLRADHPPFTPAQIHARATVVLAHVDHFDAAASTLDLTGLQGVHTVDSDVNIVGRIDYDLPPEASWTGTFDVVVIDRNSNTAAPLVFGINGGGFGGNLFDLPRRYPWLSALALAPGRRLAPSAATTPAVRSAPFGFVAVFPGAGTIAAQNLLIALIYVGRDGQIYWAASLPVRVGLPARSMPLR